MTNITDLYWEASGVSLHTHAWAIETFGGSRNQAPGKRGENFVMPYRPGSRRTKKYRDSRALVLPMWIQPQDQDGELPIGYTKKMMMHNNWEYLVSLFDTEDEFPLTKRFYKDTSIIVATAMGELLEAPEPQMISEDTLRAAFVVELADPWFYKTVAPQAVGTINVAGNAPTEHIILTMSAGRVTNTRDGNWIEYTGAGTATIDIETGNAMVGGQYVNGLIDRNPEFPEYLRLYPGSNVLTGSGTIEYEEAWK